MSEAIFPARGGAGSRVLALRRRTATVWLEGRHRLAAATARPREIARPVTQVVTPSAWVLMVLSLLAVAAWTRLGWTELLVAASFGMLLLAVGVVFIFGGHQLVTTLDLSRDRVVVGERANGRLHLLNDTSRRTLPVTIELPIGQGRAAFELPSLRGHHDHEELFAIPTARRAVYDVGPVTAVRADPLGLLRREQRLGGAEVLYVHPRTVRIEGSASGILRDLEGETVRKITDHDVAFHALRNYVPGDDRRYIHWKSSARSGQLMVRQFEETRRSHLLVLLSTRLDDYASDEEFETAISIAGSMGVQTLVDGQTLTAVTSARRLRNGTTTTFLDQLSGIDYAPGASGLADLTRRASRDNTGASIVLLVCGSLVDPVELRRARRFLPVDVRTIAVRAETAERPSVRTMGDLHIAGVTDLADLAGTMRRLAS
ncbi:DUF58 domain-containing protein [Nocardioides sp. J2M5]|uniref:DUF58 domain-containing protein n=1 Tax=Nocardioides palaemonis TaxID=2829810 RepID=UPI001BAB87EC|nr:DUF58 domain-containing protein [Nocardioides palaemonis]MBS2939456.1 DUF58 domain-containing protein [Nocardioides palaemonis]